MKYFFTLVWFIVCVAVLIIGHAYWNARTAVTADTKSAVTANMKTAAANSVSPKPAKPAQPSIDELFAKTKNWPENVRKQFQQTLNQKKSFKILFVGSQALGSKDQGMMKDVVQSLTDTYKSGNIAIAIDTYNTTSKQFLADHDQLAIAAEKAQLVVFEPFLLNDNGNVNIEDSLNNLTTVINDVKGANPDTTFILQPSFPLYNAKFYPNQVARLKQYAEQKQIPYLDHWTAWPDTHDVQLKNDLLPDQSAPSDTGNQIWSQYLIHYFISN